MNLLQTGQFHGQTNKTIHLNGITLTDTEYTLPKVAWHYHENAYFTFILQGNVIEGNKKEIYNCDLLFYLFVMITERFLFLTQNHFDIMMFSPYER